MSRPRKEKCGCWSNEERWTQLCPQHEAETKEIHQRWAAELAARRASTTLPEGETA